MAFKLRIRCHGIIAAVRSLDDDHVALLLPQGDRDVIGDQVPYVRFPASAYSGTNTRHPDAEPVNGNQHVILRKERLTIDAAVERIHERLTFERGRDSRESATPTKGDETSLDWVPNLGALAGAPDTLEPLDEGQHSPGAVKDAYFLDPENVTPALLARVDFTKGRLRTSGVDAVQVMFKTRDGDAKTRNPRQPFRKAIAREFVLELDVTGESFTLQSERQDGSRDRENDMLFVPQGDLEIVIGNESAADIHKAVRPLAPLNVLASQCMAEFELYYEMCAVRPANPLLPFLSSRPGEDTCCSVTEPDPSELVKRVRIPTEDLQAAETAWTALAYLAADNSLSRVAEEDLEELEKVKASGVVAQIDRPGNRGAERLVLKNGRFVQATREPLGIINSGDRDVLTEFLRAGKAASPASNYAVFFPTHGSGLLDFTFDRFLRDKVKRAQVDRFRADLIRLLGEHFAAYDFLGVAPDVGPDFGALDFLDNKDLAEGLRAALYRNERFGILGFDACVMGLVEMAYQVRESGEYFVASQDEVRADGWPYKPILDRFTARVTPKQAAEIIVAEYKQVTQGDALATLSAVDLDAIPALAAALHDLGGLLSEIVADQIDALARARDRARAFSNFHYIDLSGFVTGILEELGDTMKAGPTLDKILAAADAVLTQTRTAVVATSNDRDTSGACGLSVYVPNSTVADEYHAMYMSSDRDTRQWHDFVVAYASLR